MITILKIAIILGCGQLWRMGGKGEKYARGFIVPFIIALYSAVALRHWWLFPLLFATYQIVHIGYGVPDNTDKGSWLGRICKVGWIARGVAGGLYALVGALPVFLITRAFGLFFVYIISNFAIGAILDYCKVKDEVIERVIGAGVGSICLYF